jgi:hypothetical protein
MSIFIISPNITIVVDISYSKHGNKFTADFTIIENSIFIGHASNPP